VSGSLLLLPTGGVAVVVVGSGSVVVVDVFARDASDVVVAGAVAVVATVRLVAAGATSDGGDEVSPEQAASRPIARMRVMRRMGGFRMLSVAEVSAAQPKP
jgi:hypothetical protein